MSERATANVQESFGRGRAVRVAVTETPAYRGGWRDGRFGAAGVSPVEDRDLSGWEGDDRLAYYHGYREGLRVRRMLGRG